MDNSLEHEERNKARVRLLLDRYGILFRELLQREAPPFRWAALFRSLRIMELSGEVVTGYFFLGIPGLQFMSPAALRLLPRSLPQDAVYWFNAADLHPCAGFNSMRSGEHCRHGGHRPTSYFGVPDW